MRNERAMQEIMTVDSMKDYMRAAGQYAARIASLTQEIQELVGDVLPHYSGWHESGARGRMGESAVESRWQRSKDARPPAGCRKSSGCGGSVLSWTRWSVGTGATLSGCTTSMVCAGLRLRGAFIAGSPLAGVTRSSSWKCCATHGTRQCGNSLALRGRLWYNDGERTA